MFTGSTFTRRMTHPDGKSSEVIRAEQHAGSVKINEFLNFEAI